MSATRENGTEEPTRSASSGASKRRQQSPQGAKAETQNVEREYTSEQLEIVRKIQK